MRAGISDQNGPKEKGWPQAGLATENRDSRAGALATVMRLPEEGGGDREDLQWTGQRLHLCQAGRVVRDHVCNLSEQHVFPLIPVLAVDVIVDANW